MFAQFFGNYLLNKGLVSPDQLAGALAVQKKTRLKLGVLAINAGYMTSDQVDRVHAEQQRVDKRIGDIAVDMGFLTRDQVEELLSSQGAAHLQLGQALVDTGAMTNAQFEEALKSYKEENSLTDVDFADKTGVKINQLISRFYSLYGVKEDDSITDYISLLFKNIIRFIGDDFTPLTPEILPAATIGIGAYQKMYDGVVETVTIIEGNEKAYTGFASRYAEEEIVFADEMADASNGEFLNLHNGLYCVNMSNEKQVEIKLDPQEYKRENHITGRLYRLPLVFPFGTVSFIITKGNID